MRRKIWLVLALSLAVMGTMAASAGAQLAVIYNGALGYAHISPTASPPGANNWSCKPSAAHPRPVVLVHGLSADMAEQLAGGLTAVGQQRLLRLRAQTTAPTAAAARSASRDRGKSPPRRPN